MRISDNDEARQRNMSVNLTNDTKGKEISDNYSNVSDDNSNFFDIDTSESNEDLYEFKSKSADNTETKNSSNSGKHVGWRHKSHRNHWNNNSDNSTKRHHHHGSKSGTNIFDGNNAGNNDSTPITESGTTTNTTTPTAGITDSTTTTTTPGTTNVNNTSSIAKTASQYVGMNNSDGKFLNGHQNDPTGWCHYFVNYVYQKTNEKEPPWGYEAGPKNMYDWAKSNNKLTDLKSAKSGDLILYDVTANLYDQHVGLIEKIDPDGTIHTIEGNWGNKVVKRTISPDDPYYSHISGVVST